MNENTHRDLLVTGFVANILFLALSLLDYSFQDSKYLWPLFAGWAVVITLTVMLSLVRPAPTPAPTPLEPLPLPLRPGALSSVTRELLRAESRRMSLPEPSTTPFRYGDYTLYGREVDLKNGGRRTIWFFAKHTPKSGKKVPKPAGYHVGVNERTGLPFLKKGVGPDGEDLTPNLVQAYRPQCAALTEQGGQCRNSARHDSKYCASHFGYQPPAIAKAEAKRQDTSPYVRGAPDTKPAVRKAA